MKLPSEETGLNRRRFLSAFSLAITGAFSWLFQSKVFGITDFRNNKNIPKNYLQNRDIPGFYIRSANPFLGVDVSNWGLSIVGMVRKPLTLAYEDLFEFKMISQVSRLKCVECWSAKAKWEGFKFHDLISKVQPDNKAKYVYFQSADSYYESYRIDELLHPRVLMVLRMNGRVLSRDHGFPIRLIAPSKYGYKNVKYITRIEFTDKRKRNYWTDNGPYSIDGTVQPGIDHPLDLNKRTVPINGGEVFHFFDQRPK